MRDKEKEVVRTTEGGEKAGHTRTWKEREGRRKRRRESRMELIPGEEGVYGRLSETTRGRRGT